MSYYQQYQQNAGNASNAPPASYSVYGQPAAAAQSGSGQAAGFTMPSGSMHNAASYANSPGASYGFEQPLSQGWIAALSTAGYPGEPTLFEELGVNFGHIKAKTWSVLALKSRSLNEDVLQDSDMAGPILFCLLFGTFLLMSGKTHFGYIYGVALFGTLSLHFLFRLMSTNGTGLDFLTTASVLGYCLLPLVGLSGISVIISIDNFFGYILSLISVTWCVWASSGLFVRVLGLHNARFLVGYPLLMFYSMFALMAIFVEKKT